MTEICRFDSEHLEGVLRLCVAEGWPSLPDDPERALRVLTAAGVTTVVALEHDRVVGFAYLLSDGEIQAYLASISVEAGLRRRGIGRELISEGLRLAGGQRVDLLSEDGATAFYDAVPHFRSLFGWPAPLAAEQHQAR